MKRKPHSDSPKPQVDVKETAARPKIARRDFPGPRGATARLRVALDREPFADLTSHARESLHAEVCGVLVGQVCEDDEGPWVHVAAVIRGAAAREGNTHVTFTQETWTSIHEALERDHRGRRIVGWYHTHPGFGVEFSEMDLFIQRNFFSGSEQIALVTDPLGGAMAVCVNTADGVEYLDRIWIDGREQPCRAPTPIAAASAGAGSSSVLAAGPDDDARRAIKALEQRVSQLLEALDDARTNFYRMLTFCGAVFCFAIVGLVGFMIWRSYSAEREPPRLNTFVPVPIQIGDRTVLVGLQVVEWKVPEDMNAVLVQLAREEMERAAKAAEERAAQLGGSPPPPAEAAPPPPRAAP